MENLFTVEITMRKNGMDKIQEMVNYLQELISISSLKAIANRKPDQFT